MMKTYGLSKHQPSVSINHPGKNQYNAEAVS